MRVNAPGTICRFAYDGDGVRRKRLDNNGTIHYAGPYERNVGNGQSTTEVVTKYYTASFGNMTRLIAFRKNGTLYWVGTDHLGGTIRVADANFNPVDQMRYKPWGESRDAGANLNTDHLFTSQIKDASIGLYWYASRAYDPVISRFVCPDTIVPSAANPQALNRYTYCYDNPLKYVDPSGHDPGDDDPAWKAEFERIHGRSPNEQDVADRNFSLTHPGSAPDGSWTDHDWQAYTQVQDILGGDLLYQIGNASPTGADLYSFLGGAMGLLAGAGFEPGPDGTLLAISNMVLPGTRGFTLGRLIVLSPDSAKDILTLIHEYVHVLQYRASGFGYLADYQDKGGFYNWANNTLEQQAIRIEDVYRANSWLPPLWEFPLRGGQYYWRAR